MTKLFCDVCGRDRPAMFTLKCAPQTKGAQDLVNNVSNPIGFTNVDICDNCLQVLTSKATVDAIRTTSLAMLT